MGAFQRFEYGTPIRGNSFKSYNLLALLYG